MLAHPQIGSLVAGAAAAVIVAFFSYITSLLKAPGKLLAESDAVISKLELVSRPEPPKPSLDQGLDLLKAQLDREGSGTSLEIDLQIENEGHFDGRFLHLWYTGPVLARDTQFREYLSLNFPVPLGGGGYSPAAGPSDHCVRLRLRESSGKPIKKISIRVFSHVPVSLLRAEWK
jgi:hypothetical protein